MSLLSFFRRNKSSENNQSQESDTAVKTVDQNLFIDNQEPEPEVTAVPQGNAIQKFLQQEFEWMGYQDGYMYPDAEYLETKLSEIKANFRLAVDQCLDGKRSEIGELKIHKIRIEGISPKLESQLDERINIVETHIHELDMQKILSVENEGMIGSPVHSYRLGFRKGIERYQQEKLFAGSTGLFN